MSEERIRQFWTSFRTRHPEVPEQPPDAFHFCDNEADANVCADLVVTGRKVATATSLAELEIAGLPPPSPGDLAIITDFSGRPRAVIRTTSVEVRRFAEIDAEFARSEGEGDLSLAWWRDAHRAYYRRVLSGSGISVDDGLLIACERFEVVP